MPSELIKVLIFDALFVFLVLTVQSSFLKLTNPPVSIKTAFLLGVTIKLESPWDTFN